jgi:hypothetical protein
MHVLVNSRFTENLLTLFWLTPSFHDGGVTDVTPKNSEFRNVTKIH